jgi:hypothetical protein
MGPHGAVLVMCAVRFFKQAVKVLRCHILEKYAALHPRGRSNGGGVCVVY